MMKALYVLLVTVPALAPWAPALALDRERPAQRIRDSGDGLEITRAPGETRSLQGWVKDLSTRTICVCDPKYAIDATGSRDTTTGLVAAIADARTSGAGLVVPNGQYRITAGNIALDQVSLIGPGSAASGAEYTTGATFLLDGVDNPPFVLGRGVSIRGLSFFWPEQNESRNAPIAYPPLFAGTYIGAFEFHHNTVVNAYQFLRLNRDGYAIGDMRIHHNRIYAILRDFEFLAGAPESIWITDNIFTHGVYEQVVNRAVSVTGAADNGSGLVRVTAPGHGFVTGGRVFLADVAGTSEANGSWPVTVVNANTLDLRGSAFAHAYAGGGTVKAGMLRGFTASQGEFLRLDNGKAAYKSTDGLFISGNLVFGKRYGLRQLSGAMDLSSIIANKFDGTATAWSIEGTARATNFVYAENTHYAYQHDNPAAANSTISLSGTGAGTAGSIRDNHFSYAQGHVIVADSPALAHIDIAGNFLRGWGQSRTAGEYGAILGSAPGLGLAVRNNIFVGGGSANPLAAISVAAGTLVIQGNVIEATTVGVRVKALPEGVGVVDGNVTRKSTVTSFLDLTGIPSRLIARNNVWDRQPETYAVPNFRYTAAAQTFRGAKTKVQFANKVGDEHGDVASSTFSAPVHGLYQFEVNLTHDASATIGDTWAIAIESGDLARRFYYRVSNTAAGSIPALRASFRLAAGARVAVQVTRLSGTGTLTLLSDASANEWTGQLGPN